VVRGNPQEAVTVHLTIVPTSGSGKSAAATAKGKTSKKGLYAVTLKVAFPSDTPGLATLTIVETGSKTGIRKMQETFHYRLYD